MKLLAEFKGERAVLENIKEIIREYVPIEMSNITKESKLVEDLGLNSYEFMSLIGRLEDVFDIEVDEREVVKIKTIGDVEDYIKQLQLQ